MTDQAKNKIKAMFLLVVFSLNTVAGFACSVGIDMGYNHDHHHGKKGDPKHFHNNGPEHQHMDMLSEAKFKSASDDDCCSNDVTRFSLLDKSVVDNNLQLEAPVFLLAFTTAFSSPVINESGLSVNSTFQFLRRSSFLNDTDIQTAIRRFQI